MTEDASSGDAPETDGDTTDEIEIRHGRESDLLDALRILEGAMLKIGASQIRKRTESGEMLVAEIDGRIVGALVRDGEHVEAIAVRPRRRGQGIGSALVEAAEGRWTPLVAEFDSRVKPFYEALGFEVESLDDGRFRGVRQ